MAQQSDWGKSGAIAGWCAIAVVIVITILAYIRPPDPTHPVKLDFLSGEISISIPRWILFLIVIGVTAGTVKVYKLATRTPVVLEPIEPPPITPLSPEFLKLENDHNELKKRLFEAQQRLQRSTDECASLRSQLDIPKLLISIKRFEVIEETDSHRVLIRVILKIYNEHRVATKLQSIGLAVRGTPTGRPEHSGVPTELPQQTIEYGFPVDTHVDFLIDRADGQSIVKSYFIVAATDGAGQSIETDPQRIDRFTTQVAAEIPNVEPKQNSQNHPFSFDPKLDRFRLNSGESIALELAKSTSGMLGFTVAPVNTSPKMIESFQVEVAEANGWSEKHQQFLECVGFNRRPAVRGGKLAPQTKHNGQWLIRVVGKGGSQFITVYNDDTTPLRWPNDDPTDIEIWRLTIVTTSSDAPDFRDGKVVAMPPCYLVVRWDKKHSTLLAIPYEKPPEPAVRLNPDPPKPLSAPEGAVVEWLRRIHPGGTAGFRREYPGIVALTPEGDQIGCLIASTANGMKKLIQETAFNRHDDLRRLYVVMISQENIEVTAAARSMLNRKLPPRISVIIGHIENRFFKVLEEHPDPTEWKNP
jgi:hypothetical protein